MACFTLLLALLALLPWGALATQQIYPTSSQGAIVQTHPRRAPLERRWSLSRLPSYPNAASKGVNEACLPIGQGSPPPHTFYSSPDETRRANFFLFLVLPVKKFEKSPHKSGWDFKMLLISWSFRLPLPSWGWEYIPIYGTFH